MEVIETTMYVKFCAQVLKLNSMDYINKMLQLKYEENVEGARGRGRLPRGGGSQAGLSGWVGLKIGKGVD